MKRVLNLGAGTQSSVLLLMADRGDIEPIDVAIFADTQWEPKEVYEHFEWLKAQVKNTPIVTLTQGNILQDALVSQVRGKAEEGNRWASMPLFVKRDERALTAEITDRQAEGLETTTLEKWLAEVRQTGKPKRGMIRRQCTYEYKIRPIERYVKTEVMGLSPNARWPTEPAVVRIYGISVDEFQRQRSPERSCFVHEYPLVKMRWARSRTVMWAEEHYPDHKFPRSACEGCPFHSDYEWAEVMQDPDARERIIQLDRAIRHSGGMYGEMYLHASLQPIEEIDFRSQDEKNGQLRLWSDECHGVCGV